VTDRRAGDDLDGALARLARRSDDLDVDPAIVDAVVGAVAPARSADEVLIRAAAATSGLEPDPAIVESVLDAVDGRHAVARSGLADGVARSGPWALGVAAMVAAACALLSLQAERDVDAAIVAVAPAVELAE
jgi:hypothetical protein